jgi:DNA end-binding protein Ku
VPRPSRKTREARARRERAHQDEAAPRQRGVWSGTISFGLVTLPVELYPASRSEAAAMRLLGRDGIPLARQFVCPADGRVVSDDEIERGYELEDGRFVVVTEEELEQLAPRRSRDIELERFVDRDAIDPVHFVRTYLVLPAGEQTKAYRLLAETMEAERRTALADFVMHGKAHAVAILADGGLLRAVTLRYPDELRAAEQMGIRAPRKIDAERVSQMKRAIGKLKAAKLDEGELSDDATARLLELAREKLARGADVVRAQEVAGEEPEISGGEVIDLVALIRKRLHAQPGRAAKADRKPAIRKTRKVPARSESRSSGRRVS